MQTLQAEKSSAIDTLRGLACTKAPSMAQRSDLGNSFPTTKQES